MSALLMLRQALRSAVMRLALRGVLPWHAAFPLLHLLRGAK